MLRAGGPTETPQDLATANAEIVPDHPAGTLPPDRMWGRRNPDLLPSLVGTWLPERAAAKKQRGLKGMKLAGIMVDMRGEKGAENR